MICLYVFGWLVDHYMTTFYWHVIVYPSSCNHLLACLSLLFFVPQCSCLFCTPIARFLLVFVATPQSISHTPPKRIVDLRLIAHSFKCAILLSELFWETKIPFKKITLFLHKITFYYIRTRKERSICKASLSCQDRLYQISY